MARSTALAPPVELERVCFRYPVAGEVSLASLESIALPMCDPGSGTVPIGGHNVRDATLESLHATVGVVPRRPTCSMTPSGPSCCTHVLTPRKRSSESMRGGPDLGCSHLASQRA